MLDDFYPRITIKENIVVNFIPVMANPYEHEHFNQIIKETDIQKDGQTYLRRQFYEGLYVTRIIIKPKDMSKVYFWKSHTEERYFSYRKENSSNVMIEMTKIRKVIKQKFKEFYKSNSLRII